MQLVHPDSSAAAHWETTLVASSSNTQFSDKPCSSASHYSCLAYLSCPTNVMEQATMATEAATETKDISPKRT